MLIPCANGLTGQALLSHARRISGSCRKAALVVTADNVYKEQNYQVPRCRAALEALGLRVELFDLDFQPAEDLRNYDIVEFIGGNPFYLCKRIQETQAANVLRDIAQHRILIGGSAAAFVFGPTLELVNRYSPEMNTWDLSDLTGIGLTEIQILPHYTKFLSKFHDFEEPCASYEAEKHVRLIRLSDGDGVVIDGDTITIYKE